MTMIIQQNAIQSMPERRRQWTRDDEEKNADNKFLNETLKKASKKIKHRTNKKANKIEPVILVPTKIEDAPLRRMDRRALNALRKRRSDKHMICCLVFSAVIFIAAGIAGVAAWIAFAKEFKILGPLVILGPILTFCGLLLVFFSVEICIRLRKQVKRVMDPSLLKTSNFHEVKHWIEPELVTFGWGQYDFQEEAQLLDQNHMRKHDKGRFVV